MIKQHVNACNQQPLQYHRLIWYNRLLSVVLLVLVPVVLWLATYTLDCSRSDPGSGATGLLVTAVTHTSTQSTRQQMSGQMSGPDTAVPVQPMAVNSATPVLVRPLAVLFGDSLTQYSLDPEGGWGAALAHYLQRKVDVINRGHSGYNSRWGLKVFEQIAQQLVGQRVELLTIWLGANDAAIPGRPKAVQHVPLQEFTSNLRSMVAMARQAGVRNIVLLTPPPVHDEGRIKHQQQKMGVTTPVDPDRTLQYVKQYADAVLSLGRELQLPVVDLYSGLQRVPHWQTHLLKDGLHFTPAGSMAVWKELKAVLDSQLPQLSPDTLPTQFPMWDQLDPDNFEACWATTLPKMKAAP